jgi:hypothetical protein
MNQIKYATYNSNLWKIIYMILIYKEQKQA